MIKKILVSCLAFSALACSNEKKLTGMQTSAPNTLTQQEKNEGWELLFDGKTTNGWHKYGGGPKVGAAWKVADNTLYLDASKKRDWQIEDGGDIVTDNEYENFHLKLDWKVDSGGNSGVIMYINENREKYEWGWMTGPEMQILDNAAHPDAKIQKHRAGDLYDLISSSSEPVKPALEWNTAEVRSLNGKLDLYLNGVNVVSTTMWDENWKKMIAGSKFKKMADFGTYRKGKLGLQDHGNTVWFRNIKIRKL